MNAEIDTLTRERDEARAELTDRNMRLTEARANLHLSKIRIDGFIAEGDALRAEVERLRPAAEAWEAWEEYLYSQDYETVYGKIAAVREAANAATDRAREAAKVREGELWKMGQAYGAKYEAAKSEWLKARDIAEDAAARARAAKDGG